MNFKRVYAVFLRQMFVIRNMPSRTVPYVLWAVLDIVLWGFITKYLNAVGHAQFSFVSTILGAVLLWDFLQRVQQGMTIPFLEDVWAHNLINLFASPLTIGEYIVGFIVTSTVTSFFGLVLMIALAALVFGLSLFSLGIALVSFLLILFLFGIALGILGATVVLRLGPYAEWFIWPIPALLAPFAGVFYPIASLPSWMQYIAHALPPSYVFEGMRSILIAGTYDITTLVWGVALAIVYVAASYGLFAFMYRVVVRKGLIARFSAEGE
jgi:ABC-2 type transport system permease protein